ncbi:MAG: phosphate acyltransferase, partial [Candidatus Omnitrophota bacterium]
MKDGRVAVHGTAQHQCFFIDVNMVEKGGAASKRPTGNVGGLVGGRRGFTPIVFASPKKLLGAKYLGVITMADVAHYDLKISPEQLQKADVLLRELHETFVLIDDPIREVTVDRMKMLRPAEFKLLLEEGLRSVLKLAPTSEALLNRAVVQSLWRKAKVPEMSKRRLANVYFLDEQQAAGARLSQTGDVVLHPTQLRLQADAAQLDRESHHPDDLETFVRAKLSPNYQVLKDDWFDQDEVRADEAIAEESRKTGKSFAEIVLGEFGNRSYDTVSKYADERPKSKPALEVYPDVVIAGDAGVCRNLSLGLQQTHLGSTFVPSYDPNNNTLIPLAVFLVSQPRERAEVMLGLSEVLRPIKPISKAGHPSYLLAVLPVLKDLLRQEQISYYLACNLLSLARIIDERAMPAPSDFRSFYEALLEAAMPDPGGPASADKTALTKLIMAFALEKSGVSYSAFGPADTANPEAIEMLKRAQRYILVGSENIGALLKDKEFSGALASKKDIPRILILKSGSDAQATSAIAGFEGLFDYVITLSGDGVPLAQYPVGGKAIPVTGPSGDAWQIAFDAIDAHAEQTGQTRVDPLVFHGDINDIGDQKLKNLQVIRVANAFGVTVKERSRQSSPTVVIAGDTRLNTPRIKQAFIRGLRQVGVHVVDLGTAPFGIVYWAQRFLEGVSGGVMISAGSQGPLINGIKLIYDDKSVDEQDHAYGRSKIADLANRQDRGGAADFARTQGRRTRIDLASDYVKYLQAYLRTGDAQWHTLIEAVGRGESLAEKIQEIGLQRASYQPLRGVKIVVDSGNGAVGDIPKTVFEALGAQVRLMGAEADGNFPNHIPDPHKTETMTDLLDEVKRQDADIGLAFSSDGQRLGVVAGNADLTKRIVDSNELLGILSRAAVSNAVRRVGAVPMKVVFEQKTPSAVVDALTATNDQVVVEWSAPGFAEVRNTAIAVDAVFGGETFNQFVSPDSFYAVDGLFYAVMFLKTIYGLHQGPISTDRQPQKVPLDQLSSPPYHTSGEFRIKSQPREPNTVFSLALAIKRMLCEAPLAQGQLKPRLDKPTDRVYWESASDGIPQAQNREKGWVLIRPSSQSQRADKVISLVIEAKDRQTYLLLLKQTLAALESYRSELDLTAFEMEVKRQKEESELVLDGARLSAQQDLSVTRIDTIHGNGRGYIFQMPENPTYSPQGPVMMAASNNWEDSLRPDEIDAKVSDAADNVIELYERYREKHGVASVAFVSYWTTKAGAGLSVQHPLPLLMEKVRAEVMRRRPDIACLGEGTLQMDAATQGITYITKAYPGVNVKENPLETVLPSNFPPRIFIFSNFHALDIETDTLAALHRFQTSGQSNPALTTQYRKTLEGMAAAKHKRIVVPEALNPLVLAAAGEILKKKVAQELILLGDERAIRAIAGANGIDLTGALFEDPMKLDPDTLKQYFISRYLEINPKADSISALAAINYAFRWMSKRQKELIAGGKIRGPEDLFYGAWMVATGRADCMVAGKAYESQDVIYALGMLAGKAEGVKHTSAAELYATPYTRIGTGGRFMLSDITTNTSPDAPTLAEIAVNTVASAERLISPQVRVAFIWSKDGPGAKVEQAIAIARQLLQDKPHVTIAERPMSAAEALEGGYNAIIAPDLDTANPLYKTYQWLCGFDALSLTTGGSVFSIHDLSRGASAKEIEATMVVALFLADSGRQAGTRLAYESKDELAVMVRQAAEASPAMVGAVDLPQWFNESVRDLSAERRYDRLEANRLLTDLHYLADSGKIPYQVLLALLQLFPAEGAGYFRDYLSYRTLLEKLDSMRFDIETQRLENQKLIALKLHQLAVAYALAQDAGVVLQTGLGTDAQTSAMSFVLDEVAQYLVTAAKPFPRTAAEVDLGIAQLFADQFNEASRHPGALSATVAQGMILEAFQQARDEAAGARLSAKAKPDLNEYFKATAVTDKTIKHHIARRYRRTARDYVKRVLKSSGLVAMRRYKPNEIPTSSDDKPVFYRNVRLEFNNYAKQHGIPETVFYALRGITEGAGEYGRPELTGMEALVPFAATKIKKNDFKALDEILLFSLLGSSGSSIVNFNEIIGMLTRYFLDSGKFTPMQILESIARVEAGLMPSLTVFVQANDRQFFTKVNALKDLSSLTNEDFPRYGVSWLYANLRQNNHMASSRWGFIGETLWRFYKKGRGLADAQIFLAALLENSQLTKYHQSIDEQFYLGTLVGDISKIRSKVIDRIQNSKDWDAGNRERQWIAQINAIDGVLFEAKKELAANNLSQEYIALLRLAIARTVDWLRGDLAMRRHKKLLVEASEIQELINGLNALLERLPKVDGARLTTTKPFKGPRYILVLNTGSSSVKYRLKDMQTGQVIRKGLVERIQKGGHADAIRRIKAEALKGLQVNAVGQRGVHGGEDYSGSVLVDDRVRAAIEKYGKLAPIHNPYNLASIRAIDDLYPGVSQVAVFDTTFHASIPPKAFLSALPWKLYMQDRIRKYGFHGTSFRSVLAKAKQRIKDKLKRYGGKFTGVICHLGNGSSVVAVENDLSVDTTMGLTPLGGVAMGTRPGDIDPTVLDYLMREKGMTREAVFEMLNRESGVK